jgi:hypothetical protein
MKRLHEEKYLPLTCIEAWSPNCSGSLYFTEIFPFVGVYLWTKIFKQITVLLILDRNNSLQSNIPNCLQNSEGEKGGRLTQRQLTKTSQINTEPNVTYTVLFSWRTHQIFHKPQNLYQQTKQPSLSAESLY